jgi:hypothetical protein
MRVYAHHREELGLRPAVDSDVSPNTSQDREPVPADRRLEDLEPKFAGIAAR